MFLSQATDDAIGRRVRLTDHFGSRVGVLTRTTVSSGGGPNRVHARHVRNGFVAGTADANTRRVWALLCPMPNGPFHEVLVLFEHGCPYIDVEFLDELGGD